jgi:hypothetical protein
MTIGFYPESLSMPQVWKNPDGSKLMVQGTRHFAENQESCFWVHFFSQIHWKFPTILGGRRVETGLAKIHITTSPEIASTWG